MIASLVSHSSPTIQIRTPPTPTDMEAAPLATTTFEPSFDLIQEEDFNTLLLYLPGFAKEELKVQLTSTRDLRISGSRKLENNTLSTFRKDFRVAENCDTSKISAKFEDGILYVRQPKYPSKTTPPASETPQPQPQPQKPAEQPRPPPKTVQPNPPAPKKTDEPAAKKSADQSKEAKKPSEKSSAAEGSKNGGREKEVRQWLEELTGGKSSGGTPAAKKGAGNAEADYNKQNAAAENGAGRVEADSSKLNAAVEKGAGRVEAEYKKLNASSPAARLKAARQQIFNGLILVFVFALGIYVSRLPWFSSNGKP